ncbi:MAG: acetyl-coenzyme A synthetase N-terminal domain-containing protein, partial [Vibrio toranzoniae]
MHESNKSIWRPSEQRIDDANLARFIDSLEQSGLNLDRDVKSYAELHQWSVDQPESFWQNVWQFCGVVGSQGDDIKAQGESRWQQTKSNRDAVWFPNAQVNYAENLLRL